VVSKVKAVREERWHVTRPSKRARLRFALDATGKEGTCHWHTSVGR